MDAAAKKWIQEYKKLFDQVARYNAGMNVATNQVGVQSAEFRVQSTATQVPKSVIKRIGKVVPEGNGEESAEGRVQSAENKIVRLGKLADSDKKTATGTEKVQDSGERFAYAGEKADTADKMKLATAEQMLKDGVDSETIRRETGWFKGYDGKWRFEIDDSNLKITIPHSRYTKLSDILQHDTLFEAYPELKEIYVIMDDIESGAGSYSRTFGDITISRDLINNSKSFKKVLLHEVQHVIQDIEQFARGASVAFWEKKLKEGYDSRQDFAKNKEKDLLEQMKEIRMNDREFLDDMELLETFKPDHPRGKIDWDTLEQIEEDSPAWKNYDRRRDALEEKYGADKVFKFLSLSSALERVRHEGERYAPDLYLDTTGEIEARDVENRLDMTEEQRKNTRPDIDRTDVVFADDAEKSFSYIGDTKDGRRCYTSGFDKNLSMDEKIKLFKDRIATIFNLGAVELKTDVKKIRIKGDRFTAKKNLYGDDIIGDTEYEAKINALYDLADILATSKYDPTATNPEESYVKPGTKPKNKAHKGVKYWYKFRNEIVFDGVPYYVTFNIRDKGVEQYEYLIEFKENKTPGLNNTVASNLLQTDQASYDSSISQKSQNSNPSGKKTFKNFDSGERFALADDDFYANGEEFASPTISTVGKDRVNYEEKIGSKEWRKTKSESAYIHAVDEMYGIQSYLEKVGKRKNAKATIQTVRSTPHMVQTMVGSVQYNVFHSDSKTARKMGDGLNVIWKPIKKLGPKATTDFNDYLLHYLNVDKYGVMERVKKSDKDVVESLSQLRKEIDNLEAQRSSQEERIFKLGNASEDMIVKMSIKSKIEEIDKKLIQARADEIALIGEAPSYAEAELKRARNEIASLIGEKDRAKAEIFTLGNDESSLKRKTELKNRMAEIDEKIKRISESAATIEEIAKSYKLAIKPVFSLDGETVGKKESEAIIKKYEEQYPEFKAVAEKIWKFSKNLNEMRVSAGLMPQSMATRLATMYPHYVPAFKAKINNSAKVDEGVSISSTVKKAKGYNSNIMDVQESLAAQVSQVVRNGNINVLATKVYDTAVKTGDAKYVDIKLPDVEGADLSTEGIERPKPHTIKFFKDGKPFEMNVSDEIYQGFKGISEQSAPRTNVFARATNKISNLYKKLVTSLSPAFMIRNAIRDIQDAGLNSKHPALFVKNIPRAWSELIKNSKNWQTYRAYGGFSSTVFDSKGISNEVGERGFEVLGISERIASGKGLSIKDAKYIKSLLTGVENLNAVVEQIPRFAEYLSSIEAGETIEQAVYNSAEVTTNFARRGATTKAFNSTIIPFLNPAIQGFDKIFRNFTDATKAGSGKDVVKALSTLLCKAIMIGIIPMMFNSIMYSDDEDYEDLREEDKENNYLIKLPNGTFIKLPRGRVASVIGGLYNRAARTVTGKDADWEGYLSNVVSQVTPAENLTRTVFSPFVDVATNRTWYGTEIEGAQFESVRPGDRYDEGTSSIAIAIGKAINYSPKKIHYLIDQYSGVIGDFLLPATTKKAEKDFFSGNFTIDPVTSNKLSDKFYKIYDEAQYTRTDGDVKAQYQVKYLNRAKGAVSEMYKQINDIQNSSISNFEKLQQVRVIRVLINEVMKNAIADYEEINKAIDNTANMGFDDSKASDAAIRYAYIIRDVYGSERALSEYNDDVYEKMFVLNYANISYDVLFDYYFATKSLKSDEDENGNTISGSKREKVVAAINSLDASDEEKLLMIATQGYTIKNGDVGGMSAKNADSMLYNYIAGLDLSDEEKLKLYKYAGYTVENGEVSGSIAAKTSSTGTSSSSIYKLGSGGGIGGYKLGSGGGKLGSSSGLSSSNKIIRLGKISSFTN